MPPTSKLDPQAPQGSWLSRNWKWLLPVGWARGSGERPTATTSTSTWLSDFKSNEYRKQLGGERYEPEEENPMIGSGASRFIAPAFADCFSMECRALKHVREGMGLTNLELMLPFVRTLKEARGVTESLAAHGLQRGEHGLRLSPNQPTGPESVVV